MSSRRYYIGGCMASPLMAFQPVTDYWGKPTGVILLNRPLYPRKKKRADDVEWTYLEKLARENTLILGISSYQEFPAEIHNRGETRKRGNFFETCPELAAYVSGWLTCGRDEHTVVPERMRPLLLSQCDFLTPHTYPCARNVVKKWDFIYYCRSGAWGEHCRNFPLALKLIPKLLARGFSMLIVGRDVTTPAAIKRDATILPIDNPLLTILPLQTHSVFSTLMSQCKYLFMPNVSDAAPRVLVMSMLRNMPVLVNASIHGGWKYVNRSTAETFTSEDDFDSALSALIRPDRVFEPRAFVCAFNRAVDAPAQLYAYVSALRRQRNGAPSSLARSFPLVSATHVYTTRVEPREWIQTHRDAPGPITPLLSTLPRSLPRSPHIPQSASRRQRSVPTLAFIHIAKCAGTSIREWINTSHAIHSGRMEYMYHSRGTGSLPATTRAIVFIRDPYARFASAVRYALVYPYDSAAAGGDGRRVAYLKRHDFTRPTQWAEAIASQTHTFHSTVRQIMRSSTHTIDGKHTGWNWIFTPQTEWIGRDVSVYKDICMRFDTLGVDFPLLIKREFPVMSKGCSAAQLGHCNATAASSAERVVIRNDYSPRAREFLDALYAKDFVLYESLTHV